MTSAGAYRLTGQTHTLRHTHDALGNRTRTELPEVKRSGHTLHRSLNHLHYGSGHLHQINLGLREIDLEASGAESPTNALPGEASKPAHNLSASEIVDQLLPPEIHTVIADFERDALHRETERRHGCLLTRQQLDPVGRTLGRVTDYRIVVEMQHETIRRQWPQQLQQHVQRLQTDINTARPPAEHAANTLFKTYRYDPTGELRNTLHSHHGSRSFAYDTTGRIEQHTRVNRQGQPNYEFMRYDPAGNVLDAFDNRLTLDAGFVANTDSAKGYVRDNLVRVYQDCRYRYDPLGRLLEKRKGPHTVQKFEWDELDQLVAVHTTRHPGTSRQTQQTTRFTYDAIGRRITKQDAFGETTFIWEGMRLIEERRNAQVISYVYEPGSYVPLARIDSVGERLGEEAGGVAGDGATHVHQGGWGEPVAPTSDRAGQGQGEPSAPASNDNIDHPFRQDLANPYGKNLSPQERLQASAQIFHFHNTPTGLPEELSDAQGDIRWQATYSTWGNTQTESWQLTQLSGQPVPHQRATPLPQGHETNIQQNLRFQGQYLDRDTGLHYNTFRFYDPDMGRFISPDPIGLAGGVNLHSYAPNPISWIDPWGWACGPATKKNSRGQWIDAQGRFAKTPPKPNYTHESYLHEAGYHSNPNAGGHAYGSPQIGKSKFNVGEGGSKFSQEIYNHPNVSAQQQAGGRWRYEVDNLGRSPGTDRHGTPVNGGRVIVEANPSVNPRTYGPGDVVTQFPK